jgi:transcription initiation factor TFIIIB Brf1 subunit/transcription initiation factor TFIIB
MSPCPECGGNLKFDPNHKRYVCQSCGLAVTREEIDEIHSKNTALTTNTEDDKERRRKDYLKWWSTKK